MTDSSHLFVALSRKKVHFTILDTTVQTQTFITVIADQQA